MEQKLSGIRFENFGPSLEVVLFFGSWKFRKIPVPSGISTLYESAPIPLVVKSYKMAVTAGACS